MPQRRSARASTPLEVPRVAHATRAANETVVGTSWGLALATLAGVGGLTRSVGNRLMIPFGLVGGLAFALASATIPYTDAFDGLFKVGALLSVWSACSRSGDNPASRRALRRPVRTPDVESMASPTPLPA